MTTTRRLSPKQQTAFDYLLLNPNATADDLVRVADVKGGTDNQAMFIWRLLNSGAVGLYATDTIL